MGSYHVIGVMSGTSLDGLDISYCSFELSGNKNWSFQINNSTTISYSDELIKKLKNSIHTSGLELFQLHNELGNFIGEATNQFIQANKITRSNIDAIASHGHTVFHQPEKKLTTQIGNGANISAITKLPVICDFRTVDIALGGQGAPLVPIGDELLFSEYDYCINLGGIANVSFKKNNTRIAFDICPVNIVLNYFAQQKGKSFDESGEMARSGQLNEVLLQALNQIDYYQQPAPKSLGIEWINSTIFPLLEQYSISIEDQLHTFVEHITTQISTSITKNNSKILITGGGAFNTFLMEKIKSKTNNDIVIPPKEIIEYKEALIFAFLGVLRLRNEKNCLKSITGATENNIGGCIYQAF
ncbi:MAG: anhydro-N-acetylmuramic acid kinase [Vicingus serpentipes]|nr:anhydro-N-acetylmuramic acid kinase [Vicingus serpentipes]